MDGDMTKPLEGLKVLDFATTIAGPHCARLLADIGADVIKIEPPEGEMMRTRPPLIGGASRMFGQLNTGKRSITMDLKAEATRTVIRKLMAWADVVVENYRPGVMKRFGLDYDTVKAWNPRLVYCSISGFGQTGPSAGLAAYAPVIHAASGYDLAHLAYQPGRERPDYCGIYVADVLTGTYAFGAIMTAISQRHTTGVGQHIDVSMLESMLALSLVEIQAAQFEMPPSPSRPLFGPTATADGYIQIAIASERTFAGAMRAAGRPDLIEDPRFKVYMDRRQNWGGLMDAIEAWARELSTEDCLRILAEHGVPATQYKSVAEALEDPQLAHRGAIEEVRDAGGPYKVVNPPFKMSGGDTRVSDFVSALGEHTREVLEEAGASAEEIAAVCGPN
jgi:CoA:oxalate CoA-transferase